MAILAATLVNAKDVASGDYVGQRVSIRGVVSAAVRDDLDDGFNWILLKTPDGSVCASTDNKIHTLDELRPLLDAEVELTGTVQRFSLWRKFLGYQMLFDSVAEGDSIKVITPYFNDISITAMPTLFFMQSSTRKTSLLPIALIAIVFIVLNGPNANAKHDILT